MTNTVRAIDLDSHNQPHISYFSNLDLWYAKRTDNVWYCEEIDPTNFISWGTTSICVGPDDFPKIVFRDPNTYQLKYSYYDGYSGRFICTLQKAEKSSR